MSDWRDCTLHEVADVIAGFAFKGEHFGECGETVVKIKDITPPTINVAGAQKVDLKYYSASKLEKFKLRKGDYAVAMTGATIGKVGKLVEDTEAYINQRVAKIDPKKGVDRDFVYFCLMDGAFDHFVQNNIDSHSAQENISGSSIGRYPISLPPLRDQMAIATTLRNLDDKIDLLHRQNKTLEAMAETLFRQWFVEEAGDEWKEGKVEDLFVLQRGFDLPSHQRINGPYPILAASGRSGGHHEYKVRGPGITTGRSGLLGKVFLVLEDFWPLNTSLYVKEFKLGTPVFSYFFLKTLDLGSFNAGSAVPTLNRNHVHGTTVLLPPRELTAQFEELALPLLQKVKQNESQIKSIVQIRDTLLPKLMSGEVRVRYDTEAA